jgi:hypothetical protein
MKKDAMQSMFLARAQAFAFQTILKSQAQLACCISSHGGHEAQYKCGHVWCELSNPPGSAICHFIGLCKKASAGFLNNLQK